MTTLKDTQKVTYTLAEVDGAGNPTPLKLVGVPTWETSNSEVVTVLPSADGSSCVAETVNPLGSATVSVKGIADFGDFNGKDVIEVVGGDGKNIVLTPGTPEEK